MSLSGRSHAHGSSARCHSADPAGFRDRRNSPSCTEFAKVSSEVSKALRDLGAMHEEISVLRECLFASDILGKERYLITLHRRHFASMLRAHPLDLETNARSLHDILSVPDLTTLGLSYLRSRDATSLHAASRASCESTLGIPSTTSAYLYLVGGHDGHTCLRSVERFDPIEGEWEAAPTLHDARKSPTVAAVAGRIWACGGIYDWAGRRQYLSSVESLDPLKGEWEREPSMESARAQGVGVGLDGFLYVVGGFDGRNYLASAEMYQPSSATWYMLPPANQPCARAIAAAVNGCLFVCGGFDGPNALATGEVFELSEGVWSWVQPMSERRRGAAGARIGNCVFACGGFDGTRDLTSSECFDTHRGFWETITPLLHPFGEASGGAVAGRLYVCGGLGNDFASPSVGCVQCYDPLQGIWVLQQPMLHGRAWAASAVLLDEASRKHMWAANIALAEETSL